MNRPMLGGIMKIRDQTNNDIEGRVISRPNPTDPPNPDPGPNNSSRLEPVNKTHSVVDGLQARVKDPLWLLGRQWQIGEFRARNGGHLVRTELDIKFRPLNNIAWKQEQGDYSDSDSIDIKMPLEMKAEEETEMQAGKPKARGWNSKRLQYGFKLTNSDTTLEAEEYFGDNLDWFNFDLVNTGALNESTESISLKPTPISYGGMPLPRWWAIEDSRVDLGNIQRPHLNFLAMLLVEFSFIYSNDWYVIPVEHKVGHLRQIDRIVAIDTFGIVSEVNPVIDKTLNNQGWELFTHSPKLKNDPADGRIFYLPNRLFHALESEPIEKVSFFRDEMANLVWAVEQKYQNKEGNVINRNDEELNNTPQSPKPSHYWDTLDKRLVDRAMLDSDDEPGNRYLGPVAKYQPKTHIPAHWVPYTSLQSGDDGQYVLRRARTIEDLSQGPQYRGLFLSESKYMYEEEVPRVGIMLNRVKQLARDCDGVRYSWHSRKKRPSGIHKSSGLRFDALIEK